MPLARCLRSVSAEIEPISGAGASARGWGAEGVPRWRTQCSRSAAVSSTYSGSAAQNSAEFTTRGDSGETNLSLESTAELLWQQVSLCLIRDTVPPQNNTEQHLSACPTDSQSFDWATAVHRLDSTVYSSCYRPHAATRHADARGR